MDPCVDTEQFYSPSLYIDMISQGMVDSNVTVKANEAQGQHADYDETVVAATDESTQPVTKFIQAKNETEIK